MGFGDAVLATLFTNRRRSDIEFKIEIILQRKLAIMDRCNEISETLAGTIFQSDNNATISTPSSLPGFAPVYGIVPNPVPVSVPSGLYEIELAQLQAVEKELDTKQKKLETELEAVKAENESMKKIAEDHAKKDFKIGG